jgi:hypothetical protein
MIDEVLQGEDLNELSFLEILDHTLNRGLVIAGEITISVADIDLVFLGVNLLLGSVETIHSVLDARERSQALSLKTEARSGGQI